MCRTMIVMLLSLISSPVLAAGMYAEGTNIGIHYPDNCVEANSVFNCPVAGSNDEVVWDFYIDTPVTEHLQELATQDHQFDISNNPTLKRKSLSILSNDFMKGYGGGKFQNFRLIGTGFNHINNMITEDAWGRGYYQGRPVYIERVLVMDSGKNVTFDFLAPEDNKDGVILAASIMQTLTLIRDSDKNDQNGSEQNQTPDQTPERKVGPSEM